MTALSILLTSAALSCFAQAGFEVASIKASDPAAQGMQIGLSPGGVFTAKNVTLKALIRQAYDVRDFQISGGPGWLDTETYDIVAKAEGLGVSEDAVRKMTNDQRQSFQDQMRARLRALLADRFQLKVHPEAREASVYALMVAKNGPKIQPAKDDGSPGGGLNMRRGETGNTEVTSSRMPLAPLIKLLSNQVGRPVLDATGLSGNYDFKMTFAPDSQPDIAGPSIFTALQEQLGLRLDAQKAPVETVVIDSAQKASEN